MKKKILLIAILCILGVGAVFTVKAFRSSTVEADTVHYDVKKVRPYVDSINKFSCDVFSRLAEKDSGNTFVSPLSIYTVMSVIANGATDSTQKELASLLGVSDIKGLNEGLGGYFNKSQDEDVTLTNANSVWLGNKLEKSSDIESSFITPVKDYYNAEVYKDVDFGKEETVNSINDWVSKNTNDRIKEIVGDIDPDTVAMAFNAIYFKAKWTEPFEKLCTTDEYFNGKNKRKQHKMMNKSGSFNYYSDDNFCGLELDYGNGSYVMDLLLSTDDTKNTCDVWNSLSTDEQVAAINAFETKAREEEVTTVKIPKLGLEYSTEGLTDVLKDMGASEIFDMAAHFDNIGSNVKISGVLQKTMLKVDEESTEAAAVSELACDGAAPMMDGIEFVADRPYMLFLRDTNSGIILFAGAIQDVVDDLQE